MFSPIKGMTGGVKRKFGRAHKRKVPYNGISPLQMDLVEGG